MCCVEEQSELEMVAKANKNMVKKNEWRVNKQQKLVVFRFLFFNDFFFSERYIFAALLFLVSPLNFNSAGVAENVF
jgi:hypothetical protein